MKKILLSAFALCLCLGAFAQNEDVTIKKGKCTMSEAYYQELLRKANAYEQARTELTQAQQQIANAEKKNQVVLRSFNDSASYAIGRDLYSSWTQQNLGIDARICGQSLINCANNAPSLIDQKAQQDLLRRFQQSFEQRQQAKNEQMMAGLQDNIAAGKKFLEENKNNKSVYTTPSGLQYKCIRKGNGKKPTAQDQVKCHYTGSLINGTKFDSSVDRGEPIVFPLGAVIPGWTEGLQLMDEGSKYTLYIPYNLGYGEQPVGDIPPGSTLIFEVELLEINPK